MKTLKFEHSLAKSIIEGKKNSTWRMFDDKDLSVGDQIRLVDQLDPKRPESWRVIGHGTITQVVEKRLADINPHDMQGHETYASPDEMLTTYKGYYGDRVTLKTPVKIIYFDFNPTIGEKPSGAMLLDEAIIYTDGGSRGNPGDSACAFVICKMDGTVVEKAGSYLGVATNNQAEYAGFKYGLERALSFGIKKITLYSDSELVVKQMLGLYKVKNQELAPLHQEVKKLAESFEKIDYVHIPREQNEITDSEVNRILDRQQKIKKYKKH